MSKFYISDLHFSHSNIIKFDNRPFSSVEEMESALIQNWNNVVSDVDDVYVLGDFCWSAKDEDWIEILNKLNGHIHLISGNHDKQSMSQQLRKKFSSISNYKEVKDDGRRVILSHYPMPFYRSAYNPDIIHLYGHVHSTLENDFMEHIKGYIDEHDNRGKSKHQCQFYNVGCMMPYMNYTPRTLDEIINTNSR